METWRCVLLYPYHHVLPRLFPLLWTTSQGLEVHWRDGCRCSATKSNAPAPMTPWPTKTLTEPTRGPVHRPMEQPPNALHKGKGCIHTRTRSLRPRTPRLWRIMV